MVFKVAIKKPLPVEKHEPKTDRSSLATAYRDTGK
jgi:hypothetical protein